MKQNITRFLVVSALVVSLSLVSAYFTNANGLSSAGVDSGYKVANDLDWQRSF